MDLLEGARPAVRPTERAGTLRGAPAAGGHGRPRQLLRAAGAGGYRPARDGATAACAAHGTGEGDRKSTRLNSSHSQISYAVFCLKKKKKTLSTYMRTDNM